MQGLTGYEGAGTALCSCQSVSTTTVYGDEGGAETAKSTHLLVLRMRSKPLMLFSW